MMDDIRYLSTATRLLNESFSKKVYTFDATSILPNKSEFYRQFLRAHYTSCIWRNAFKKQPTKLNPLEYCWIQRENSFVFKWCEGDQRPGFVSDFISEIRETDVMDNEDDFHGEENFEEDE